MPKNKHYHGSNNKIIVKWMNESEFKAMITIKFMCPENNNYNLTQLEKIIRNMNKYIYGKNYNKQKKFINGFVSIEKNSKNSPNKYHVHLLVKWDNKIDRFDVGNLLDIAIKSSSKIKSTNGHLAFHHGDIVATVNSDGIEGLKTNCLHIIEPYNEFAAAYIVKTATDMNCDQIKMLSSAGLSDRDLSFLYA